MSVLLEYIKLLSAGILVIIPLISTYSSIVILPLLLYSYVDYACYFFFEQKLSWVDIQGYYMLDTAASNFGVNLADYPKLQKLHDDVADQPNIKKWLETRPKTEH